MSIDIEKTLSSSSWDLNIETIVIPPDQTTKWQLFKTEKLKSVNILNVKQNSKSRSVNTHKKNNSCMISGQQRRDKSITFLTCLNSKIFYSSTLRNS